MNTRNMLIAVLSGAVLTTLVSNLPVIDFINCLLFAGFWGSALAAVWLYRRLSGMLTMQESVRIGALTGLCAGVLGFSLTFLGLTGFQGLLNKIDLFVPGPLGSITFTTFEVLAFNFVGVIFNLVFGAFGGWIGGAIFRTRALA
jgi:hypothetical protein